MSYGLLICVVGREMVWGVVTLVRRLGSTCASVEMSHWN